MTIPWQHRMLMHKWWGPVGLKDELKIRVCPALSTANELGLRPDEADHSEPHGRCHYSGKSSPGVGNRCQRTVRSPDFHIFQRGRYTTNQLCATTFYLFNLYLLASSAGDCKRPPPCLGNGLGIH